ncbi:MAG: GIY-YIG nuclease family protein [Alphaproteobacteria bacterium]
MRRHGYTYILASKQNGTLYVGVTNDLVRRVVEHRSSDAETFTRRYGVTRLVWFEVYPLVAQAIAREKQIKAWRRDWKVALIEERNPTWSDLFPAIARP